ncbi:hypothetical protein LDENG_00151310 [Lucifuga dentata]|nr:hypothetical protein LDENG_00151310 [Lucifuga dentata]
MEVWKVGKTFLIHCSSSMLWEMIVNNVMCMKIECIRLRHEKWMVWSFNGFLQTKLYWNELKPMAVWKVGEKQ